MLICDWNCVDILHPYVHFDDGAIVLFQNPNALPNKKTVKRRNSKLNQAPIEIDFFFISIRLRCCVADCFVVLLSRISLIGRPIGSLYILNKQTK